MLLSHVLIAPLSKASPFSCRDECGTSSEVPKSMCCMSQVRCIVWCCICIIHFLISCRRKGKCEGGTPCTWCSSHNIACVPQSTALVVGNQSPKAANIVVTIEHPSDLEVCFNSRIVDFFQIVITIRMQLYTLIYLITLIYF